MGLDPWMICCVLPYTTHNWKRGVLDCLGPIQGCSLSHERKTASLHSVYTSTPASQGSLSATGKSASVDHQLPLVNCMPLSITPVTKKRRLYLG